MSIRGRGNSTWNQKEKKPFKIKLDKKEDIFGFGKNKHWVLLANAFDPSLIRNRITFKLSEALGFEFTPQGVPVDLVIKGDRYGTKYLGNYWFGENIRVDDNRLEIDELDEDDTEMPAITGGYLIQNALQVNEGSPNRFNTTRGEAWATDTPSFDVLDGGYVNDAQKNYIRSHLNTVEDALFEGGEAYRDLLDMKSAASYWLINTLAMNLDAYKTSSTYIYKKRDANGVTGKVYWGPVWDFDYAWDEGETFEGMSAGHLWMKPLFTDRSAGGFIEEVRKQWPAFRKLAEQMTADGGLIDQYYEETKLSAERDHLINPGEDAEGEYSYKEKVEKLKTWIQNRLAWLDANIGTIDELVHTVRFVVEGEIVDQDYCEVGDTIMIRAEDPVEDGCIFMGWEDEDGSVISFEITTDRDMTLTAKFIPESEAVQGTDIVFAKSYDVIPFRSEMIYTMDWYVLPQDAYDRVVEWSSSDESIASVDEFGDVTIHAPGTVIITGTLHNGVSKDFPLTITEDAIPLPQAILPDREVIHMTVGETTYITMRTEPALANVGEYVYESEDPEIAEAVFYGVIKALAEGTARIHVQSNTYEGENTHTCDAWVTVIVSEPVSAAEYTVVSGENAEWKKGSREGITLTVKRSEADEDCFAHFTGVQINGSDLVRDTDYTAKAGSTIVALSPAYLESLPVGEHTLTVVFDDGKAEMTLLIRNADTVPDQGTSPDTGDGNSAGVWFLMMTASLSAFAAGMMLRRKLSR
ncbi:MAG: CotH kinase family protein [Solobacterium sp.]|nr:CotH kinase family protein [Solobacterium sp.]